ncbi:hypothetical protein BH09ACT8_BH09ACT8_00310 [soil metagenome]
MAAESAKATAWAIFDRIVADAAPAGVHTNPWHRGSGQRPDFAPDFAVLQRLLGVPLYLRADTNTGVPALALDVWLSYELRRAGFEPDAVWPRSTNPRIMPRAIASLLAELPRHEREPLQRRLFGRTAMKGVVGSSANILGKNYVKQVDVVISDWDTGPELLISTKRMDSSFGKNAANRVEESYGDVKNLRLRHPLAALGFVYGLRSTILETEPNKAEWLIDLLQKLGNEDDAYHAVALVMIDYEAEAAEPTDHDVEYADDPADDPDDDPLVAAGVTPAQMDSEQGTLDFAGVEQALGALPEVTIRHDEVPDALQPSVFLAAMVRRVLDVTPVARHREARVRLRDPA